ncbi:uncharacterized protein LOC134235571 [Saccostrea cucullata]|uniref:uncharacterized protein LOC134235571 n=1 Tax=Saccostrea cuccullata TaxID=36930 RepID=UPI002ED05825
MDNIFLFNYPSDTVCRILSFLQMCVPGASAHVLVVISLQRYLLVCKPFGPKMTLFWKRVFFGIACGIAIAYSVPVLRTSGVLRKVDKFMNHTVTIEICKFSVDTSPVLTVYFGLLFLIILANIGITTGLYVPVLRQVQLSFRRKIKVRSTQNDFNFPLHTKSSQITQLTELDKGNCGIDGTELQRVNVSIEENEPHKHEHIAETLEETSDINTQEEIKVQNPDGTVKCKQARPKDGSVQTRITKMFLVIIIAYVLAYIPPLVILILIYAIKDFNYITLSESETLAWLYFGRFIFMNNIVNPFIYGYFDTKFRKQIQLYFKQCKRKCFCIE